jgi:hypothetical protein
VGARKIFFSSSLEHNNWNLGSGFWCLKLARTPCGGDFSRMRKWYMYKPRRMYVDKF